MNTTVKYLSIEKLASIVKPFVGSLKGKNFPRPILKTALITNEYIIATDSYRLIRIKHNQDVNEPYLYHFKPELTKSLIGNQDAYNYPNIERLLPDRYTTQKEILIGVNDWIEAHELGLIAAKEHKNTTIHLSENVFSVNAVEEKINKKGKLEKVQLYDQIAFKYTLPFSTAIEKVAYNCEYMLDALKIIKKLGHTQAKLYFYGPLRPLYFVAGDIEILILPVRTY